MNPLQETKSVTLIPPQLANNGAVADNTYFDTMGMLDATVEVHIGDSDVALGSGDTSTPLFLEECDTTGGTYTPVEDAELEAVISSTDDNKIYRISVDLKNRTHKQYMRLSDPTAGNATGVNLCAFVLLTPQNSLDTAALKGLAEEVIV